MSEDETGAPHRDRPLFAIVLRLLAMVIIAATYVLAKMLAERGAHIVEIAFYRQLFAFPVAAIWAFATIGSVVLRPNAPMKTHIARTVLGFSGMILNFAAVVMLPLAEATSIGFTMPIFATILSALLLGEKTGVHRWAAVMIGFVGVVIMAHPESANFASLGLIVALAGAVMTAIVAIVLRDLGRVESPPTVVFWFTLLSLPPLGIATFLFGGGHDPVTWLFFIGIGVAGGLAQCLMTSSLRWGPVSIVIPMDYSNMIWSTWAGWVFWATWPVPSTWLGAALIMASGLYIAWREHVRQRQTISPQEDRAGRSG